MKRFFWYFKHLDVSLVSDVLMYVFFQALLCWFIPSLTLEPRG